MIHRKTRKFVTYFRKFLDRPGSTSNLTGVRHSSGGKDERVQSMRSLSLNPRPRNRVKKIRPLFRRCGRLWQNIFSKSVTATSKSKWASICMNVSMFAMWRCTYSATVCPDPCNREHKTDSRPSERRTAAFHRLVQSQFWFLSFAAFFSAANRDCVNGLNLVTVPDCDFESQE